MNRKYLIGISITIVIAIIIVVYLTLAGARSVTHTFTTYTDADTSVSFSYPSDIFTETAKNPFGIIVLQSAGGTTSPSLSVAIFPRTAALTDSTYSQYRDAEQRTISYGGGAISTSTDMTIAGMSGHIIVGTYNGRPLYYFIGKNAAHKSIIVFELMAPQSYTADSSSRSDIERVFYTIAGSVK